MSESDRAVTPEGVALAILVASPTFLGLSILAVITRAYVRVLESTFSLDDCLLIGGLVSVERTVYGISLLHHLPSPKAFSPFEDLLTATIDSGLLLFCFMRKS